MDSVAYHGELLMPGPIDDALKHLKALIDSDLAIITSSMPHNLPGPRQGDELIGRFDANPDMCLVAALPLRTVREIRVYRHRRSGCDAPMPDKR